MNAKSIMARFYKKANGDPTKLPWYQKQPFSNEISKVLPTKKGKALDVGCGSGEHSIWLAQQGFEVTGIDMFEEAISMATKLSEESNIKLTLFKVDLFAYSRTGEFDLVYDSGCLHSLVGGDRVRYKQKVTEWLAPNGTFVLMHWGKRNVWDWRPIGPKRKSKNSIIKLFEPELQLDEYSHEDFKVGFLFGPVARGMCFKFIRT